LRYYCIINTEGDGDEIMKLHVGCGNVQIPGYINIDTRYQPGVDQVDNIKFLRRYKSNSIEVIYACAVLEHFTRWEYKDAINRWYDLLIPGGTLRISVPGFEDLIEHYLDHKNLRILMGMFYGGQDYAENFHHHIWDFKIMEEDLLGVGFKEVRRYDWRETEHSHIDDFSQSYLPHLDKENGKLMHLNVEAVK